MKSLDKALDILELAVLEERLGLTPGQAADVLGLNIATCSRIMNRLCERGYLIRLRRRGAYAAGPMIATLFNRQGIFTQLSRAAEPRLRKFAAWLDMPVNLAVMHGKERIMLCFSAPATPGWLPWHEFRFSNHATSATGRLLLSTLPAEEAAKCLKGVNGADELLAQLPEIRKQGFVDFDDTLFKLRIQGMLIDLPGCPPAAIGYGVRPEQSHAEAMRKLTVITEEIRSELLQASGAF